MDRLKAYGTCLWMHLTINGFFLVIKLAHPDIVYHFLTFIDYNSFENFLYFNKLFDFYFVFSSTIDPIIIAMFLFMTITVLGAFIFWIIYYIFMTFYAGLGIFLVITSNSPEHLKYLSRLLEQGSDSKFQKTYMSYMRKNKCCGFFYPSNDDLFYCKKFIGLHEPYKSKGCLVNYEPDLTVPITIILILFISRYVIFAILIYLAKCEQTGQLPENPSIIHVTNLSDVEQVEEEETQF